MGCSEAEKKRAQQQAQRHKREMEARTRGAHKCFSQICFGEANIKPEKPKKGRAEDNRFPDPQKIFEKQKKPPFCGADCPFSGSNNGKAKSSGNNFFFGSGNFGSGSGRDCNSGANPEKSSGSFSDSDNAVLLPLMMLLFSEKADFRLILALMYIMM